MLVKRFFNRLIGPSESTCQIASAFILH